MANYRYSCIKKVSEMIATIRLIPSYGCLVADMTHEALKQLASKTKHFGQYCVRLSHGYS